MKKLLAILFCVLFATVAFASSNLMNKDTRSYKLLVNSSPSCFSGTHTSISSNNSTSVSSGWACLDEIKPAVKLEDGKSYVIKIGKIQLK